MSVRDASTTVPNTNNPPGVTPQDQPYDTDYDSGYGTDEDAPKTKDTTSKRKRGQEDDPGYASDDDASHTHTTSNKRRNVDGQHSDQATDHDVSGSTGPGEAHSFWNEEQKFDADNEARNRKISNVIGDATVQAAGGNKDGDGSHATGKVFKKAQVPIPPKGMLSKVARAVRDNPGMKKISEVITGGINGSNPHAFSAKSVEHVIHLAAQVAKSSGLELSSSKAAAAPPANASAAHPRAAVAGGNTMCIVFLAMAASMDEDNKIKAGHLKDMQKYNKISELISNYISNVLQPAQAKLDQQTAGKDPNKTKNASVMVETWTNVDTDNLYQDKNGNVNLSMGAPTTQRLQSQGLSSLLTSAQGWSQSASNNNEQASNKFQATDHNTTNTFTMLAGFVKSINDTAAAVLRNYA